MPIKPRRKILTNTTAAEVLQEGKSLAAQSPALALEYAKDKLLLSNPCTPCRKPTPTVSTVLSNTCLLCGNEKEI